MDGIFLVPHIFTDDDSHLRPRDLNRRQGLCPRHKPARLVKHIVNGEQSFDRRESHFPFVHQVRHIMQRGMLIEFLSRRPERTDQHRRQSARLLHQILRRGLDGFHERSIVQNISRRIPGDGHLREDDQLRALRVRLPRRVEATGHIAFQVSNGGVDLGEGEFHDFFQITALSASRSKGKSMEQTLHM